MNEDVINNIVRVGTVSAVDAGSRRVRVIFKDDGNMTSEWLYVLQHGGAGVYVKEAGEPEHTHEANVTTWMPTINQTVLVLYLPIDDSDGFVLGAM